MSIPKFFERKRARVGETQSARLNKKVLFVALVLAWYHGERGAQRVSGTELLILALLLAMGGGLLWRFAGASHERNVTSAATPAPAATSVVSALAPIPEKSIAVLPFENLSDEKSNAYFADGIQDEILTKLASIADLKVISRTSTAKYKSKPEDLKTVSQQLGVATVLEGSVQKAGDKVRVNVQLIDARVDTHLWAKSYDRDVKDIFAVESEVSQEIADALKAKLSSTEATTLAAARPPTLKRTISFSKESLKNAKLRVLLNPRLTTRLATGIGKRSRRIRTSPWPRPVSLTVECSAIGSSNPYPRRSWKRHDKARRTR